jgi:Protein of unknown function (DUF2851)
MNENLLQFIWQFQRYNTSSLTTSNNEVLTIVNTGTINKNQGPDFLNATIILNNIKLVGNIELHTKSSDWLQHKHNIDSNYNNIILHVVWINNKTIIDNNNLELPTLELQNLVPKVLLQKYENLMQQQPMLPCASFLPALSALGWLSWKERLATERLIEKSNVVLDMLTQNNNNWEETFWQLLAYNFGLKNNAHLFKNMAVSVTNNLLSKHKNQIHQIEALLLGQCNFLNKTFDDSYAIMLQKEYLFLQKKYNLVANIYNPQFLRMRPANFPSIRLAQLAVLVQNSSHLFSKIKAIDTVKELQNLFDVTANDYWQYHYQLNDDESEFKPKNLGKQMINSLLINTIIPTIFAYGVYNNNDDYKQKAILFLQEILPEKNSITNAWAALAIDNKNALDSQALLQLTKQYCLPKKCLHCAVGAKILNT